MTLTFGQWLKILIIRSVISVIWTIDWFGTLLANKLFLRILWNIIVFSVFSYFIVYPFLSSDPIASYKKSVSMAQNTIVESIYGVDTPNIVNGSITSVVSPVLTSLRAFPYISARAHLVIDNNSSNILSEHNLHVAFAPASTTKLMTALVTLDLYNLDELIMIPEACAAVESTKLWLPTDEEFLVEDMLASLLISSAADAGCALANSKVSQEEFIERMNSKAAEFGMKETHFTNEIGLDSDNGEHYASAWDLYLLSEVAMSRPLIRDFVGRKLYSFGDINIQSTNTLLWEIPETIGIKTGRTEGAGEVLIYRFLKDEVDLTIIVMSSEDRFSDTRDLLDWTLSSYEWK